MLFTVSANLAATSHAASETADERYAALARAYFASDFVAHPINATGTGVHAGDARLDDISPGAFDANLTRERRTLATLDAMDPHDLSPEVAVDRTILSNQLRGELFTDGTQHHWRHDPDRYVGLASTAVYSLAAREFASPERRMALAIARERELPAFLARGRANLGTIDAASKEVALEDTDGAIDFFSTSVPEAFAAVRDPGGRARLRTEGARVVAALRSYETWLRGVRPAGTFAIGAAAYRERLRDDDGLDISLARYRAVGEAALAATRREYVAVARAIDPTRSPAAVATKLFATNHPSAANLRAKKAEDLVRLRAFLIAKHIVTLPADANVAVVDTPAFQRSTTFAAFDGPGPLEAVDRRSFYFVTPVDTRWPAARQAGFLSFFNDFYGPLVSAHEIYPGHFTNYAIDKHLPLSLTRKLIWNVAFGEGWAHYDEQMVVDEGWGDGDKRVRLGQLQGALLRECRYLAGVGLHTQGWSVPESERFFQDRCFQTNAAAITETMRGTQDPMYGYYTLGKLMILKLRADYARKLGPAYTLEKFHDALLAHGDPPVPLARKLLLGSSDDGAAL